jgi:sulfite exporter TauE/SafE
MDLALPAAYSQLLGVGVLWIALHCAGMCGPIVVGLDVAGSRCGTGPGGGFLRLLAYQGGRAITYSVLGALAGLLGAGLKTALVGGGGVLTVVLGLGTLGYALKPRRRAAVPVVQIGKARPQSITERALEVVRTRLLPLTAQADVSSRIMLGAVLGLMPCMITLWALGLAASTLSPLHGAGVMVLLVVLTTPTLTLASAAGRWLRHLSPSIVVRLQRGLLVLSGLILVLAGLAALDIIDHAHLGFMAGGRHYMIMFW